MKIWKDIFTGDEIGSDSYPVELIDDLIYEVQAKMITKSDSGDYDIGANASAEGADEGEGVDSTTVTVNNVVDAHRLAQTAFDKAAYMGYIKQYMKKLKDKLTEQGKTERAEALVKNIQPIIKKVIGNIKEYDFFVGEGPESLELNGMVVLMFYKEDGITPYFWYFKDGLDEEKV